MREPKLNARGNRRGTRPGSLAALTRARTAQQPKPLKVNNNAAWCAKMRAARARKRMIEREFPVLTPPRERPVEDVTPDVVVPETRPAEIVPTPPPAPVVARILEKAPEVPEESDGERRARLAKRDYDLLMHTKGGWRELNRLRGLEPTSFPRVVRGLNLERL
jgi:hypothetical protein